MPSSNKSDIIRAIFAAYLANDRKQVELALADDFHFTSPCDDNIDKPTYFERCWKNTEWIARHELERIFVEGDEAFVTYLCIARDGKRFHNTEFFTFAGDKVKRIDVYFGASYQDGKFVPSRYKSGRSPIRRWATDAAFLPAQLRRVRRATCPP